MIHEYRRYRLKPGALPDYLDAFETIALPLVRRHMDLLGFWSVDTGPLNHVHHLWAFADHSERVARYGALRAEPDYQQLFLPRALPLIEEMTSQILLPVPFAGTLPLGSLTLEANTAPD